MGRRDGDVCYAEDLRWRKKPRGIERCRRKDAAGWNCMNDIDSTSMLLQYQLAFDSVHDARAPLLLPCQVVQSREAKRCTSLVHHPRRRARERCTGERPRSCRLYALYALLDVLAASHVARGTMSCRCISGDVLKRRLVQGTTGRKVKANPATGRRD